MNYVNSRALEDPFANAASMDQQTKLQKIKSRIAWVNNNNANHTSSSCVQIYPDAPCSGCPAETVYVPGVLFGSPTAPAMCTNCFCDNSGCIPLTYAMYQYEKASIEAEVAANYLPPVAATLTWCGANAGAGGDPHMTNVAGKNFDVQDEGDFTLLTYPASAHSPLLNIAGQIERYASSCHSTFIKQLMLSGQWVVPMNVSVEKVISKKPKLLVTRDRSFEKMSQEEPLITTSKQEREMNIDIKSQNITIHIDATNCRRKQWCDEGKWVHLNLDVQGLSRLESNELGGILGNDPYVSSTECTTRNLLQTDDTSLGPLSYATVTA